MNVKILFIEDDLIDQMGFKRLIKKEALAYDYKIADSVQSAQSLLKESDFDVVVIDYNLGDGTAFDVFPNIKSDTSIIFCTGAGDEKIAVKALQKGASEYMIKDHARAYLNTLPTVVERVNRIKRIEQEKLLAQEALAKSEEQFRTLFENSPDAIFVEDRKGKVLDVNPAACKLHHLSREKLIGINAVDLIPKERRKNFDANLGVLFTKEMKSVESVSLSSKGVAIPVEISSRTMIYSEEEAVLLMVRDITERKKQEAELAARSRELILEKEKLEFRLKFEELILSISTQFIKVSPDKIDDSIVASLKRIGEFVKADRCYIFKYSDDGKFMSNHYDWCSDQVIIKKSDLQNIPCRLYPHLNNRVNNLEQIFFRNLSDMNESWKNEKRLFRSSNVQSVIIIPLFYEGDVFGFIGVNYIKEKCTMDDNIVKLLVMSGQTIVKAIFKHRVDMALQDAHRSLLDDVKMASTIQTYMVPSGLKYRDDLAFSSFYAPSSQVGGDLYDYLQITKSQYMIYIADISGHGVQAALLMTAIRSIITMLIKRNDSRNSKGGDSQVETPSKILEKLNNFLMNDILSQVNNYFTMMLGLVDLEKKEITFANAGHPPLLEYDIKTGKTRSIADEGSIPIGWKKGYKYSEDGDTTIKLKRDNIYILYTDGTYEAQDSNDEELGLDKMKLLIDDKFEDDNCFLLPQKLKHYLNLEGYNTTFDDFAVLAFQYLPKFDQSEGKEGERRYFLFQLRTLFPSVDKMANECSAITAEHTGSELTSFAVELVFREYLNNIIEHGLGMRKDSAITIELTILKMEIVIRFIDYGVDWEFPLEFIENSYDQNIVSEETRGRGMMMIRTQVTELKRERFENTNVTRFVIPIQND